MKSVARTAWGLAAGLALGLAAARAPAMQLRVQPMDAGTNAWVVAAGETCPEETLLVARDVSWSGTAERDLWVVGQKRVAFGGRALQDARLAGASVEITDGAVSGNLAVAGQGVRLAANVPVEGDLAVLAAGEALCEADVRGDARVWASEAVLGGSWGGDVKVTARRLRLKPGTRVAGKLVADVDEPFVVGKDVEVGEVVRLDTGAAREGFREVAKRSLLSALGLFLGTFLAGWVFLRLFPERAAMAVGNLSRPLPALLTGVAALPALLLVGTSLALTRVGFGVALLLWGAGVVGGAVALPVAALGLGHLALRNANRIRSQADLNKTLATGAAMLGLAWLAPGFGGALVLAGWVLGMGSLAMSLFQRAVVRAAPPAPPAMPPPPPEDRPE